MASRREVGTCPQPSAVPPHTSAVAWSRGRHEGKWPSPSTLPMACEKKVRRKQCAPLSGDEDREGTSNEKANFDLSEANMRRLTPEARAMIEDAQKAATILVQFEDGTQLDSCGPIGPNKLSNYFELAPGQTLQPVAQGPTGAPATLISSTVVTPKPLTQSANVLSDDQVKLALNGKGRDHWVLIQDMGLMAAQGNQVPTITLYMPEAVLAIRAEAAKKQFIQYKPSEEDKRRSLMIVAQGYAGKTITEGCTSITRVVLLSDPSGDVVKEAYLSEPLAEVWRNNFGATSRCQALRTMFSLDDVRKVRAAAPNGEFLVAVFSGSVNTKTYKIKRKHQSKLDLD